MMKNLFLTALILMLMACNDNDDKPINGKTTSDYPVPVRMGYSIVNTYPHDTGAFTQGLTFYEGELFEGTGNYGQSRLRQVNPETGTVSREIKLDDSFFGEGITILNDTVYQLTWREGKVFLYNVADFKRIGEFSLNMEGWGLTTDGTQLILSNGSNKLFFHDRGNFKQIRVLEVFDQGTPAFNLNELEFIDGYVYANQWQFPYILKIDPATGNVVGKADLTDLWNRVKVQDPNYDVPNGIAYDSSSKRIFITGKNWPELYEIKFSQ